MGDQMFNDLVLSRDMMREYHSRLREDAPAHRLTVMVLQASVWPFSARTEGALHLPHAVSMRPFTRPSFPS
jgi:cullin-4